MMSIFVYLVSAIIPLRTYVSYLDPGSGSFILQILIATLVGGLYIVSRYWARIKGFFRKLFTKGDNDKVE
jgi:hypothetical protein